MSKPRDSNAPQYDRKMFLVQTSLSSNNQAGELSQQESEGEALQRDTIGTKRVLKCCGDNKKLIGASTVADPICQPKPTERIVGCAAPRAYGDSSEDSILLGEREELAEDCFQDGVGATADKCMPEKRRVLLVFTGSVATVKVPEIYLQLSKFATVKMIASSSAASFFLMASKRYNPEIWHSFEIAGGENDVIPSSLEWCSWQRIGDPVVHIELRRWADIILVAPASADFLAKLAFGQADSLALSVLRAWDIKLKPSILCPAMNTVMWEHPVTLETIDKLAAWNFILSPVSKKLACNEVGRGALVEVSTIVRVVQDRISKIHWDMEHSDFLEQWFLDRHDQHSATDMFVSSFEDKFNTGTENETKGSHKESASYTTRQQFLLFGAINGLMLMLSVLNGQLK